MKNEPYQENEVADTEQDLISSQPNNDGILF